MPMLYENCVQPTPLKFVQAEAGLLAQVGGQKALWAGRAATALYVAYEMAKARRAEISQPEEIVPAMMCATAANTAILAGITPRFADVDPKTGLITLETVRERLTENTIAVVAIHLLGHAAELDPIKQWCEEQNLLLIEDPTQALGGVYPDGRALGSVGDVAVFSFNRTKIISVGNGVLTANTPDTVSLLDSVLASLDFPQSKPAADTIAQLGLSYRNLHHSLVGLLRVRAVSVENVAAAFMCVQPSFLPMFFREANPEVDLNAAWDALPESLERRLKLANIYAERLQEHPAWDLLTDFQQSGVCWRFSLLLKDESQQVAFSEAVRKDGFHVSNLYWPVNQFFRAEDTCPGADSFGWRIVNLWVDSSVDEDFVQRCCDSLLRNAPIE